MNDSACALTIAGLDPGGGAGIAADLRAFAAAGAFGCAVVAVVTVQSTAGLRSVTPLDAKLVTAQAREVLAHQRVRAWKTGALGTAANVRAVARLSVQHADVPLVVDPVIAPTRGRGRLLAEEALDALRTALVPQAALVTANAPEATALTGLTVRTARDARAAGVAICGMGAFAALVKGGHLDGEADAIDTLVIAEGPAPRVVTFRGARLLVPAFHGGGCTLASLVAGRLAVDPRRFAGERATMLVDAVRWAKRTHRRALRRLVDVGGPLRVLDPRV